MAVRGGGAVVGFNEREMSKSCWPILEWMICSYFRRRVTWWEKINRIAKKPSQVFWGKKLSNVTIAQS